MKKKKSNNYVISVISFFVMLGIIFSILFFGSLFYEITHSELEQEKSTIYTSCFDQYGIEHLVSYEVPSYKVQEELKNQIVNIYCPEI